MKKTTTTILASLNLETIPNKSVKQILTTNHPKLIPDNPY
jgi:hypothetical protein